jgi:Ser/Thr protein kinase RdoA (MazF antagonist)
VTATGPAWAVALAAALGASDIRGLRRLSGGASRETWELEADGRPLILQRARPGGVSSAALTTEVELLRAARSAGVPVPAVVVSGGEVDGDDDGNDYGDAGRLGRSWMVVERIEGETIPRRILRDAEYEGNSSRCTGRICSPLERDRPTRRPIASKRRSARSPDRCKAARPRFAPAVRSGRSSPP